MRNNVSSQLFRRMMNIFIMDLCEQSQGRIDKQDLNSIDDVA